MLRRFAAAALLASIASNAFADSSSNNRVLPSQREIELPEIPEAEGRPDRSLALPPAPEPALEVPIPAADDLDFVAREIEIEGNTVLPATRLEAIAAPYTSRPLRTEDLIDLERAITAAYHDAGYATSFATLPDQDLTRGVLRVRIVEGRLGRVVVQGARGFRSEYLVRRIETAADGPLDVIALRRRLQVLNLDPRIESLRARLSAGLRPGISRLDVSVEERSASRAEAIFSNDRSPSLGALNGRFRVAQSNAFGWGDEISATAVFSEGIREVAFDASVPVNRYDTTLGADVRYSDSDIVAPLFSNDDLESRFLGVGLFLEQPIFRSPRLRWHARFDAQLRENRNTIRGRSFATSSAASNGRLRTVVFRFSTLATWRDRHQAIAFRTLLNVGAPILGAASTRDGVDDSDFVSWIGQLKWARRIGSTGIEMIARFDWQLAGDPLPPSERFALGGMRSVRGYPENRPGPRQWLRGVDRGPTSRPADRRRPIGAQRGALPRRGPDLVSRAWPDAEPEIPGVDGRRSPRSPTALARRHDLLGGTLALDRGHRQLDPGGSTAPLRARRSIRLAPHGKRFD